MNFRKGFADQANFTEDLEIIRPYEPYYGSTSIVYSVLALLFTYQIFHYVHYPVWLAIDLGWRALVFVTPSRIIKLLDSTTMGDSSSMATESDTGSRVQSYKMKGEALKRIFGLDTGTVITKVQQATNFSGISHLLPGKPGSDRSYGPPGLGNWDNSCYQNSIIQGLASLPSLSTFLDDGVPSGEPHSTKAALTTLISKLNDPSNEGKLLWTPAGLKSMSSWQQQDAQEYFSKVLDEVDREVSKALREMPSGIGLGDVSELDLNTMESHHKGKIGGHVLFKKMLTSNIRRRQQNPLSNASILARNPLEGLLAQRVGCLRCGYVEGLSLIPFNCLTVPLGKQWIYDVRTCLDDYTTLEPISGVECTKCTVLRSKDQLERLLSDCHHSNGLTASIPVTEALQASVKERLSAVTRALNDGDFSDSTLLTKCQIPPKNRVSTTKSRQAVIARPPKSLVIHINRSVFDESTGLQRKNLADVQFPKRFDLAPWCLGYQGISTSEDIYTEDWTMDPSKSMLSREMDDEIPPEKDGLQPNINQIYDLRAVITHYGRHENGHYICYRKHKSSSRDKTDITTGTVESWWRLSDEAVSKASEDDVLAQGGVFMLFYERADCLGQEKESVVGTSGQDMGHARATAETIQTGVGLGDNGVIHEESMKETSSPKVVSTDPVSASIDPIPQLLQNQDTQYSSNQKTPLFQNQEQISEMDSTEDEFIGRRSDIKSLAEINANAACDIPPTYDPHEHTNSSFFPLNTSVATEREKSLVDAPSNLNQAFQPHVSKGHHSGLLRTDAILAQPFQSEAPNAENSPNTSVTTSTTASTSHTPITEASPPSSPIISPTIPSAEIFNDNFKENGKLSAPLMRTSGSHKDRGSVTHASNTMENVSTMVTAS